MNGEWKVGGEAVRNNLAAPALLSQMASIRPNQQMSLITIPFLEAELRGRQYLVIGWPVSLHIIILAPIITRA